MAIKRIGTVGRHRGTQTFTSICSRQRSFPGSRRRMLTATAEFNYFVDRQTEKSSSSQSCGSIHGMP